MALVAALNSTTLNPLNPRLPTPNKRKGKRKEI
jgi:hypothetical protein